MDRATAAAANQRFGQHDLPRTRVGRALRSVKDLAAELGVDARSAELIASQVIADLGEDTVRVGYLCTRCQTLCPYGESAPKCPTHGNLNHVALGDRQLLIAFPNLTDSGSC